MTTDRGFTGQRREGGSRLGAYFYNARFYATGLGHFMSADTSSADGLDRYAYVRFNPLLYSDPSGHGVTNLDGTSCPPTRPDCENDGGAPPVGGDGSGGNGDQCDTACQWKSAWDAFHPASGGSNNGGAAPPTPSQTPVPDTADAGPLPEACGSTCPSVPIHPNSEARRQGACIECALADKVSTVAAHAYNIVTSACGEGLIGVGVILVGTYVTVRSGGAIWAAAAPTMTLSGAGVVTSGATTYLVLAQKYGNPFTGTPAGLPSPIGFGIAHVKKVGGVTACSGQ